MPCDSEIPLLGMSPRETLLSVDGEICRSVQHGTDCNSNEIGNNLNATLGDG